MFVLQMVDFVFRNGDFNVNIKGTKREQYLGLAKPPEVVAAMRAVKAQFDPRGILNPYKV